jgi:hypothetical protein
MVENEPEKEGSEVEETDEKTVDETMPQDNTCDDSIIEAFVHMLALRCLALQNVSVQLQGLVDDFEDLESEAGITSLYLKPTYHRGTRSRKGLDFCVCLPCFSFGTSS